MNKNHGIPQSAPVKANDEPNILPSGMGAPPVSHGKKIEPILPDDDLDAERLTEQSVDAAEDDLMTEARKAQKRNDKI